MIKEPWDNWINRTLLYAYAFTRVSIDRARIITCENGRSNLATFVNSRSRCIDSVNTFFNVRKSTFERNIEHFVLKYIEKIVITFVEVIIVLKNKDRVYFLYTLFSQVDRNQVW